MLIIAIYGNYLDSSPSPREASSAREAALENEKLALGRQLQMMTRRMATLEHEASGTNSHLLTLF